MTSNGVVPANSVLFQDFCAVLERLHKKKKDKKEQVKILENFINHFRLNVAKIEGNKNGTFFPILRLLLPDRERERSAYNIKESKLKQLLVNVLALSEQSQSAQKLLNYTSVQNNTQGSDLASVAYFVIKDIVAQNSGNLTIQNINDVLDKIADAEVGKKRTIVDEAFSYVIKNTTAEQVKWFLRIILKDLKLGMGHNRILAAFHPDAPDLYENCGNLSKVCEELEDGNTRPSEMGIQMYYAVSPMLSERLNITEVSRQLRSDKTYQIESKFDGERFQMHMQNGVFEYYSRKGYSYADKYGKTYDSGLLTPLLKNCFSASVTSFILDGEMMGWHKQKQCFSSKGMSFDIKKITDNSKFRPCFCVFDILYFNGKPLVGPPEKGGMPLSERLMILDTMFTDVTGVIQHSKRLIVKDSSDILEALNKAIEDQEEGIVVKQTDSYYIANRRNAGWYKMKPEYIESTMSDLDLVIIGADEAEDKSHGRAKCFHVACADVEAPGATPRRWVLVARVSTGLSHEARERVCDALERRWVPARSTPPPPCLLFNKKKPDFWILPEHSVVLQVRATELIRSTEYGAPYTLRFPRVVRVRDDKPVGDVMTLAEFNQLVADKGSVVKLSTKQIESDQIDAMKVSTRRKRPAKVLEVAEQFRTKTGDVEVVSRALLGRKLCVLSGDQDCSKHELIRIIESHGGRHVENPGADTWCTVVGQLNFRARQLIASRKFDVSSARWLHSLPVAAEPLALCPLDMLAVRRDTRLGFCRQYDSYGDDYTALADEHTLRECFDKMDRDVPNVYLTTREMIDLDRELFGDNNPFSFLRPCFIHLLNCNSIHALRAKMYGATLCDIQSPHLTHIIVPASSKTDEIEKITRNVNALVVSDAWLEACFLDKTLVPEESFVL